MSCAPRPRSSILGLLGVDWGVLRFLRFATAAGMTGGEFRVRRVIGEEIVGPFSRSMMRLEARFSPLLEAGEILAAIGCEGVDGCAFSSDIGEMFIVLLSKSASRAS